MGLKCLFGHQWNGCKCERYGKTRDEQHDWEGCKCKRCGQVRDEQHDLGADSICNRCWKKIPHECKWEPKPSYNHLVSCSECTAIKISLDVFTEAEKGCVMALGYATSKTDIARSKGLGWSESSLNSKQMYISDFALVCIGLELFKDEKSAWLPTAPKDKATVIFNSTSVKAEEIKQEIIRPRI